MKMDILKVISDVYDISRKEIVSHRKHKLTVEARDVYIYLLHSLYGFSFSKIGRIVGGRDHTTIIHSWNKIIHRKEIDPILENKIEIISNFLNQKKLSNYFVENFTKKINLNKIEDFKKKPIVNYEVEKRNKEIMKRYRQGETLEFIGSNFNITRERVRQIVSRNIKNEVFFKKEEGLDIDEEEFLRGEKLSHNYSKNKISKEEKESILPSLLIKANSFNSIGDFSKDTGIPISKIKSSLPEIVEIINRKIEERKKRWSRFYVKCRKCGTTQIPHSRRGYCEKCDGSSTKRRKLLLKNKTKCSECDLSRLEALNKYGRDLYITAAGKIFCRGCFLKITGKKLSQSKLIRR